MNGHNPLLEDVLGVYADTLKHIREFMESIPDERMAEQPGGVINHPAWTLGHLHSASGLLLTLLDAAPPAPAEESRKFGPGSKPVADRSAYASKESLLASLMERHVQVEAAVRANHRSHFPKPPPEFLRAFAPTVGRISIYLLAAHEPYHLGQLMPWKRAAGLI
ncbi:MAG: DinB family protein [Planctomycetota bacterium]|nr:DinB family protein [Planctomycetota bacterium]